MTQAHGRVTLTENCTCLWKFDSYLSSAYIFQSPCHGKCHNWQHLKKTQPGSSAGTNCYSSTGTVVCGFTKVGPQKVSSSTRLYCRPQRPRQQLPQDSGSEKDSCLPPGASFRVPLWPSVSDHPEEGTSGSSGKHIWAGKSLGPGSHWEVAAHCNLDQSQQWGGLYFVLFCFCFKGSVAQRAQGDSSMESPFESILVEAGEILTSKRQRKLFY